MTENERFISFMDIGDIEHTVRIIDIQAVGVGKQGGKPQSYVRIHSFPHTVPFNEAVRVRKVWLQEG